MHLVSLPAPPPPPRNLHNHRFQLQGITVVLRDRSLFIAESGGGGGGKVGGAEDLGLDRVKFSRSPLWMLFHWSDLPPTNVFIYQANLSAPSLNPKSLENVRHVRHFCPNRLSKMKLFSKS